MLRDGTIVYSVNSVAAIVNHSCNPNATLEEDDNKQLFICAKQDIFVGEEILYNYNGGRKGNLGFVCQCKACNR